MNVYPIRDHIAANTDLVVGETLFSFHMPPDIKRGVLVITENSGDRPDHEISGIFKARYQVIVRDYDFDNGMRRAEDIYALLNLIETDMNDYVVTYSRPRNTPLPFSRSSGDMIEFSINFDIRYRVV